MREIYGMACEELAALEVSEGPQVGAGPLSYIKHHAY